MHELILHKNSNLCQSSMEELLAIMTNYGKPRIHCLDNMLWCCVMEMLVTGKGVTFKVSSEYDNVTPLNAVQQCYTRMSEALDSVSIKITNKEN